MEPSEIGLLILVFVAVLGSLISVFDHRVEPDSTKPPKPDRNTPEPPRRP